MAEVEEPDGTTFTINLPMPLDVAAALTHAVGAMWPTATMSPGTGGLRFHIPNRKPARVSKKSLREMLPEMLDTEPELILEQWANGAITVSQEAFSEAQQRLGAWALIMLTSEAAPNYVEQEVVAEEPDGTSRRFHVSAAWSKGQSPHARLKAAEGAAITATAVEREALCAWLYLTPTIDAEQAETLIAAIKAGEHVKVPT